VLIKNLTKRLVIVALDRESLHLRAGETSRPLDATQVSGSRLVDKLVKGNVIAVIPAPVAAVATAPVAAAASPRKSRERPTKLRE